MTDQHIPDSESKNSALDAQLRDLPSVVSQIVSTMQRGNIKNLVLKQGDFHLELTSAVGQHSDSPSQPSVAAEADADNLNDQDGDTSMHVISSPMIGTFYVAPAPGEQPFVQPGDTVAQGDTIGIVEAMKIMNEIATDRGGIVVEVAAQDGETVEYGSPLIRLQAQS